MVMMEREGRTRVGSPDAKLGEFFRQPVHRALVTDGCVRVRVLFALVSTDCVRDRQSRGVVVPSFER